MSSNAGNNSKSSSPPKQAKQQDHQASANVKQQTAYIISKRQSTHFNPKVSSIINEQGDQVYAVSGNQILVYSLTTGILTHTFRSKRQIDGDQNSGDKIPGQHQNVKGDVHKANIVALHFTEQNKLISLCSRGILAEWEPAVGQLINIYELKSCRKIKHAEINNDHIITYDSEKKVIQVFDSHSKNLLHTLQENQSQIGSVNAIAIKGNSLAYIKGRFLNVIDLLDQSKKEQVIQRDVLLKTLQLNDQATLAAMGDIYGKIYIVHLNQAGTQNKSQSKTIVQTLHWHAKKVNSLKFLPNTPYLLSAGEEGVIVQWHLETQNKTFISRIGSSILNINLSHQNQQYYSLILENNSLRVVRFDNNKTLFDIRNVAFNETQQTEIYGNNLVTADKSDLLFYDLVQGDQRQVQVLKVKQRNFASSGDNQQKFVNITSFAMTPDQKSLATFEELIDIDNQHKSFKIQSLKFWHRDQVASDLDDFQLVQLVNDPCLSHDQKGLKLKALNNNTFICGNGNQIQIWTRNQATNQWQINDQFNYQGLDIVEIHTDIKLRNQIENQNSKKCLVILHEGGVVTYWDQDNYFRFVVSFKLNQESKKIVFESSNRFMASLTVNGGVEVWKTKGVYVKHQWDLDFKSVKDIQNNSQKENQFILAMNSADNAEALSDSILMFQYSRPQNLVMYWKSQLPFLRFQLCDMNSIAYILIINKNQELQRIYLGADRSQLKKAAQTRRLSMDVKIMETENKIIDKRQADYSFIDHKPERRMSDVQERQLLVNYQETQIQRLDQADKIIKECDFIGMPSLGYCFDQFIGEMLPKPKDIHNLIDLQEEIMKNNQGNGQENQDIEMEGDYEVEGQNGVDSVMKSVEDEITLLFANLLK
eukprot:403361349